MYFCRIKNFKLDCIYTLYILIILIWWHRRPFLPNLALNGNNRFFLHLLNLYSMYIRSPSGVLITPAWVSKIQDGVQDGSQITFWTITSEPKEIVES